MSRPKLVEIFPTAVLGSCVGTHAALFSIAGRRTAQRALATLADAARSRDPMEVRRHQAIPLSFIFNHSEKPIHDFVEDGRGSFDDKFKLSFTIVYLTDGIRNDDAFNLTEQFLVR